MTTIERTAVIQCISRWWWIYFSSKSKQFKYRIDVFILVRKNDRSKNLDDVVWSRLCAVSLPRKKIRRIAGRTMVTRANEEFSTARWIQKKPWNSHDPLRFPFDSTTNGKYLDLQHIEAISTAKICCRQMTQMDVFIAVVTRSWRRNFHDHFFFCRNIKHIREIIDFTFKWN